MAHDGLAINQTQGFSSKTLPFARSYQLEALEKAIEQNTIVFLETGSGKTLIAVMLLRSYAHLLRNPSPYVAIFLVPTVVLVPQQASVVTMHTDLRVGKYWGEMGVDFWDAAEWKQELSDHEVLVMTPAILLSALRHSFIKLEMIKVLIFDECHNAKGNHPYACIMKEFYHQQLHLDVPRILGMTASPIKEKCSKSASVYWKKIQELENLMNSKVYTCESESVLANYIPFSAVDIKFYNQFDSSIDTELDIKLERLLKKHKTSIEALDVKVSFKESTYKKLTRLASMIYQCANELGLWLALEAAEIFHSKHNMDFFWGALDACCETIVKGFTLDVQNLLRDFFPSGSDWSICDDIMAKGDARFVSKKTLCLLDILLQYRNLIDLRCIVFVERVITAIAIQALLNKYLPEVCGWKATYIAGNNYVLMPQSRNNQNTIVDKFRKGDVNIIVATSILEEGLDVQGCNLVVRFDLPTNVCSFIQSRGRARMQNSDFVLMVETGNARAESQISTFLDSTEKMREESLRHSCLPCEPVDFDSFSDQFYRVENTGAIVNLQSSVGLVYFYCSRLPCDMYFKSVPRFNMDECSGTCILQFPNSSPVQYVTVEGNGNMMKQIVCLEACKKLHEIGALTDHLVPDVVQEKVLGEEQDKEPYDNEHNIYMPPELVGFRPIGDSVSSYYCYLIKLKRNFDYGVPLFNMFLLVKANLEHDFKCLHFDLMVDRGSVNVEVKHMGMLSLTCEQVTLCRKFQLAILKILRDHSYDTLTKVLQEVHLNECSNHVDYLILPSSGSLEDQVTVDWECISAVLFQPNAVKGSCSSCLAAKGCADVVHTKNGSVPTCVLKNCLVYTPHNGRVYCIYGSLDHLNGNSELRLNATGEVVTYKEHYKIRYGIDLHFKNESLLKAVPIFKLQNCLSISEHKKNKEAEATYCELPPELCFVVMSPISVSTFYAFSLVPSIMHRIESLLMCGNLKKIISDFCMQNVTVPTAKVLEAITTKKCQEGINLESLEALGDSFLKYAVSQQLFKTKQNHHEGLLSLNRQKIVRNSSLCRLGCSRKIPGFIRNEPFEPKRWEIPGDPSGNLALREEQISTKCTMYTKGTHLLKMKRVADVVEALIGAFLSSAGEIGAISFMNFLGMEVDLSYVPYNKPNHAHPTTHVNISQLESLLSYSFHDRSLLVEALTHGSYMLRETPRGYQRLEFLGDSVLDHLITLHLYRNHPEISPGLLTNLRSASVNNYCYALAAIRAGLHKNILHASHELHRHIAAALQWLDDQTNPVTTFGYEWDSPIHFPKVLGDVIESLAGAIYVDSGYNKDVVFSSIRPLLEPLVTPETLKPHPVQELNDLCQKYRYNLGKLVFSPENGISAWTQQIEANGELYSHTCTTADKKTAQMIASRAILQKLKGKAHETT